MARRRIPSPSRLWERHEALYVGIFVRALGRLSVNMGDWSSEDDISEQLCPLLTEVCFEESGKHGDREIRTPDWEKPIQPVSKNELKGAKGRKRPDFTCKLSNPEADSAAEYEIPFHIECKLLGAPTSRTWILTENYVTRGIKRFDSPTHEYGKRASSGMMVGYLISMTPEGILEEINSYQKKHLGHNPAVQFECSVEAVRRYGQELKRKNVSPREFRLIHLWIDLRNGDVPPEDLESGNGESRKEILSPGVLAGDVRE